SLNEQSFSDLPSSAQPESMRKTHPFSETALRSPQLLEDLEDRSLKDRRDKFEWIRSNDTIESVISCETTKATWTDLVHSFEGPLNTKENRIMDLKLEYNTFKAKPSKSLSQTYTQYKSLLNELSNDGVALSKREINIGFMNSLPKNWLSFPRGLRNANHTQTLDLADIYGRFV
ncbi:hypothetical protein Tco_1472560, partial [Tanacetum coccineum]